MSHSIVKHQTHSLGSLRLLPQVRRAASFSSWVVTCLLACAGGDVEDFEPAELGTAQQALVCPTGQVPIVTPADVQTVINDSFGCSEPFPGFGCRADRDVQQRCPAGYLRSQLQVTNLGGRGAGNCGEGDPNDPSSFTTHWLTSDPTDCSIHEHAGVSTGFGNSISCRYVVRAERPATESCGRPARPPLPCSGPTVKCCGREADGSCDACIPKAGSCP